MVGEAAWQFLVGRSPVTFDGGEDVASLPVPVEVVEVGVERVVCGVGGGIGVVRFLVGTDVKGDGCDFFRREAWKGEGGSTVGDEGGRFRDDESLAGGRC